MWVITANGETYYVDHVDATIPWTTRERPDHESTKGSLKFVNCLLSINDDNEASINVLTDHDKSRLRNRTKGITRIITLRYHELTKCLKDNGIKHGPVKSFGGACTRTWYVVDILDKSHLTMLSLVMQDYRVLAENEFYYKAYDDPKFKGDNIDMDKYYDAYEEDEEDEEGVDQLIRSTSELYDNSKGNPRARPKTWSISKIGLGILHYARRRLHKS